VGHGVNSAPWNASHRYLIAAEFVAIAGRCIAGGQRRGDLWQPERVDSPQSLQCLERDRAQNPAPSTLDSLPIASGSLLRSQSASGVRRERRRCVAASSERNTGGANGARSGLSIADFRFRTSGARSSAFRIGRRRD
jgi:hypothetical protein